MDKSSIEIGVEMSQKSSNDSTNNDLSNNTELSTTSNIKKTKRLNRTIMDVDNEVDLY